MTKLGKLAKKFTQNPSSVSYKDIERMLVSVGFEKIQAKGSHVKFKHVVHDINIIVPVHNKECKEFYKKYILQQTKTLVIKIK